MLCMKYIVVAFWSVVLGNVLGFIVGQLSQQIFNPLKVTIVWLIIGELAAILITHISQSANSDETKKTSEK
ncbi:hypothetical protein OAL24_00954 [Oenococcus sicerae]|nr:hypothetical protein OAL24_00954 [Oenococcus sicerae]